MGGAAIRVANTIVFQSPFDNCSECIVNMVLLHLVFHSPLVLFSREHFQDSVHFLLSGAYTFQPILQPDGLSQGVPNSAVQQILSMKEVILHAPRFLVPRKAINLTKLMR